VKRTRIDVSDGDNVPWSPSDDGLQQQFGLDHAGSVSARPPRVTNQGYKLYSRQVAGPWFPDNYNDWKFVFSHARSQVVSVTTTAQNPADGTVTLTSAEIDALWAAGGDLNALPDSPLGTPINDSSSSGSPGIVGLKSAPLKAIHVFTVRFTLSANITFTYRMQYPAARGDYAVVPLPFDSATDGYVPPEGS
jgi:hypothetical protein